MGCFAKDHVENPSPAAVNTRLTLLPAKPSFKAQPCLEQEQILLSPPARPRCTTCLLSSANALNLDNDLFSLLLRKAPFLERGFVALGPTSPALLHVCKSKL